MEERLQKSKTSRGSFLLQILHFCISLGLIATVVYFQIQNNTRLDKLELKQCQCEERSPYAKETKANLTISKNLVELGTANSKPITKRDLEKFDNRTIDSINNRSIISSKMDRLSENITSTAADKLAMEEKEVKEITKLLDANPISCTNRLKVIIDNYLASNKKASVKECTSTKGQKGDVGQKGQQGERGCSSMSFAPPYIEPRSRTLVTKEGETVVLRCNATANPAAKIKWYRDGMLIGGSRNNAFHGKRYSVTQDYLTPYAANDFTTGLPRHRSVCPSEVPHPVIQSSLVIRNIRGSDTGSYSCNALNFMGDMSLDIQITVQEYVRFSISPSNVTVVEGEDALLSCRASGVPRPTIKWQKKDSGPMPSQYRVAMGDLQIENISKKEEGTFVCLAKNVLGSKTAEATVTVNVFPKFHIFHEKPLIINKTENLILPCNATGYPIPQITWQKINGSLPDGRYVYNSQFLNISHVQYGDGGEYKCTARNSVAVISTQVSVAVQIPPVITKGPDTIEYAFKGKTKILEFDVFSKPEANVTWIIPKHVQETQRIRQENTFLVIDNVQYADSGHYQAVARNLLGEVRVRVFMVVRDPVPSVIRSLSVHPFQSRVLEGQNVTLECIAVGIPRPLITWQYDNETLISSKGYQLTLRLENVTVNNNAGMYFCTVSNQFGSDQRSFDFKVVNVWVRVNIRSSIYGWRHQYPYWQKKFTRSTGQINSYQYPNTYRSNTHDRWTLTSNTRIKLEFVKFETERCCDKVIVYDGSSTAYPKLGEFSGETLPPTIISSSKSLYVTFITDGSKARSGFKAFYSAII